ncbi:MAG: hypothetical protein HY912_23445 [Desulfomonile tiedjei]|uniref:Uncharacterized protein n=1 Tax=Desulfomonile tiedjei TaxID=2358 RepID=A0A9D6V8C5_9BACT|nr:hypothetical protein [Desulfomonile tiedjei]
MKELEILKKLAAAANREQAPEVSVSAGIIAVINARDEQADRPLMWIAGLASAAALTVGVLAVQTFDLWLDPALISAFSLAGWVTL